ncbi:serine/threonine protein kinase [Pyrenophora tritici-repentis]|nr:serine/threonine protein kinase [Pyrenophora tritici-repentis]KAI0604925.1 serine/threonine protein kinase [Pyrenophora tritici-repentis]KAI0616803.1 serine/threonine protein kinase [Pyrenophora tritici-repentis]
MVVFATLTGVNAPAKWAIHRSAARYMHVAQGPPGETFERYSGRFLRTDPEASYHHDVAQFRRTAPNSYKSDTEQEASDEHDDDMRKSTVSAGTILTGNFVFDLQELDPKDHPTWTLGKGRHTNVMGCQFLVPPPNLPHHQEIRGYHVRFGVDPGTGYIRVKTCFSSISNVFVNGQQLTGAWHVINQDSARIQISGMNFELRYTEYAHTPHFYSLRNKFVQQANLEETADTLQLTQTPGPRSEVIGGWTLGKAQVAAVKRIIRKQENNDQVLEARRIMGDLTVRARQSSTARILVLADIHPPANSLIASKDLQFEDNYLFVQPVATITLGHIVQMPTSVRQLYSLVELMKEMLQGAEFLHENGFVHGDVKPQNVGLSGGQAILLDVDGAVKLDQGKKLNPTPGSGGTVGYLAPEREMYPYDHTVDIWAIGVVGLMLRNGQHPWYQSKNPWRIDHMDLDSLIPRFWALFRAEYKKLKSDTSPLDKLFRAIFCDGEASANAYDRVTAAEALQYQCFK